MIASIVFATFLCTVTPDNKDKCERDYLQTWENVSEYQADKQDCEQMLSDLFPDDVRVNTETGQYQFAGCYRVIPGEWVQQPESAVYLQNVVDADDSFIDEKRYFD